MTLTAYHGTTEDFEQFELGRTGQGAGQGHVAGRIGIFLSACPKVATTFTLESHVWEQACEEGRSGMDRLLRDPYRYDEEPWLEGAHVVTCEVDVAKPMVVPVQDWVDLVDRVNGGEFDGEPCPFRGLREAALRRGCDHILIPAAGEGELSKSGDEFVVEYSADVIVVLDPAKVRIVGRSPSAEVVPSQEQPLSLGTR